MARCPHCSGTISLEIEQYGGECPNCYSFLEGNVGEDAEFEPTGMFTKEQLAAFTDVANEEGSEEDTGKIITDELDLEDVLAFADEITDVIEPTEPLGINDVTAEERLLALDADEDVFDFDDEPTMALVHDVKDVVATLNEAPSVHQSVNEERAGNLLEDDDGERTPVVPAAFSASVSMEESSLEEPSIVVAPVAGVTGSEREKLDSDVATSTQPVVDAGHIFEDDSEEESFDGLEDLEEDVEDFINPLSVSPVSENYSGSSVSKTKLPQKKSSFDWKPIVGTIAVVCIAVVMLIPKPNEIVEDTPLQDEHEFAVPEVQRGALAEISKPEETKVVRKTKKQKTTKPQAVDKGGVRTFQTAQPVAMGRSMAPTDSASGQSDKLERDVAKLKKSMKYCHTKALKTDPNVSGKWEVRFKVSSGSASNIKIKAMRSANSDIETCMQTKIKRFNFSDSSTVQNFKFRMLFER